MSDRADNPGCCGLLAAVALWGLLALLLFRGWGDWLLRRLGGW